MGQRAISIVPRASLPPAGSETAKQSASRLDPLVDQLVGGRFHVQRVLARGGMGRVYYATQEPLGRAVALKVVRDDAGADAMRPHERFLLEADILARVQHPNVVSIVDFGALDGAFAGQSYIVMELLPGVTLEERLRDGLRLGPAEVLSMTAQVARGLRAAHDRGIVHRDLKPSNIVLVPDGDGEEIVKLVDFGIAKLLWGPRAQLGNPLTGSGAVVGTPKFMAPEQVEGDTQPAADLYAVGTIMFLALTGRLPFDCASATETLRCKISKLAPRLREAVPDLDVSDELESLVASLLAREPEQRPTTSELVRALAACASALAAVRVPDDTDRLARVERRDAGAPPPLESSTGASLLPASPATAASSRPRAEAPAPPARSASALTRLTPVVTGALIAYAMVLVYLFGARDVVAPRPAALPTEVAIATVAAPEAPRPAASPSPSPTVAHIASAAPPRIVARPPPHAPAAPAAASAPVSPWARPTPPVTVQVFSTER